MIDINSLITENTNLVEIYICNKQLFDNKKINIELNIDFLNKIKQTFKITREVKYISYNRNNLNYIYDTSNDNQLLITRNLEKDNFENYKANLKEMVEHFRKDLNEPNLPFICGELSERPDFIDFNNVVVRKIKEYIPNSDYVTAEGTKLLEDNIHFDAESARKLGERYAQKVLELTQKK